MTDHTTIPYLAHVKQNEAGTWESHELEAHLRGTAELAGKFAAVFGSADWAGIAALWHDLGKYGRDFQNYIKSASGYDPEAHIETGKGRVNHSSAGALYAVEQLDVRGRILAYGNRSDPQEFAGDPGKIPQRWLRITPPQAGGKVVQAHLYDAA